jgi:pyrimidine deaminase RibD-like protein
MANKKQDEIFMAYALQLAQRSSAKITPLVGCIIAKNDKIIAQGWQQPNDHCSATCQAFKNSKQNCAKADLYLTMEPAPNHDEPNELANTLKEIQINRVVIGCNHLIDKFSGIVIAQLKKHQIAVTQGVLAQQAKALNAPYAIVQNQRRPQVIWLKNDMQVTMPALTPSDQYRIRLYLGDLFEQVSALVVTSHTLQHDQFVAQLLSTPPMPGVSLPMLMIPNNTMVDLNDLSCVAGYQGEVRNLGVISFADLLSVLFENSMNRILVYSNTAPASGHLVDHYLTISTLKNIGTDSIAQFNFPDLCH